jgi:hypothetical protein
MTKKMNNRDSAVQPEVNPVAGEGLIVLVTDKTLMFHMG